MNREHAKEEAERYMQGARGYLDLAIKMVKTDQPISQVRACYTRVRECISDSQEYLRALKNMEAKRK